MEEDQYEYRIVFLKPDGSSLGEELQIQDEAFGPAEEWSRFEALREDREELVLPERMIQRLPLWHQERDDDTVTGFRIRFDGDSRESFQRDFPIAYFGDLAREASSRLVQAGKLCPGEVFHYRVKACRQNRRQEPAPTFGILDVTPRLPVVEDRDLPDLLNDSVVCGKSRADDFHVFIPRDTFQKAIALTRLKSPDEGGGILAGKLCRDGLTGELFLEVVDLFPARHTVSERARLRFTSETWASAEEEISRLGQEILMVGWEHSHAFFMETCGDCPSTEKEKALCRRLTAFFSDEDIAFQRLMFGTRPYGVGLVIGLGRCGMSCKLFGWRSGMTVERGFHMLSRRGTADDEEA